MGRKARAVQPWSSAEAAKRALVAEWGASVFEEACSAVERAELEFVLQPIMANRRRALLKELDHLQQSARAVSELVGQLPEFDPNPASLLAAALRAHPQPLGKYLQNAQADRTTAEMVDVLVQELALEEKQLRKRLRPAQGFGEGGEVPDNARLLAAARALRELKLTPTLTGTKAAWLSIALKMEEPATSQEEFQDRRRTWDARLKRKSPRQDTLDRLRGQPPKSAVAQEHERSVAWVKRFLESGRHEETLDLLGPTGIMELSRSLNEKGDPRLTRAFEVKAAKVAQRLKARKKNPPPR